MAQATPKVFGKASFGFDSLFHPTPDTAKTVARVVLYGTAIIGFVLATFPNISEHFKATVSGYLSFATGLVYFVCHMFGIAPEGVTPAKQDNTTIH